MLSPVEKVNSDQFRYATFRQQRPDRFKFSTIGENFSDLDGWIWDGVWSLVKQRRLIEPSDGLPFHYTAFFEPLGSVFADDVFFLSDQVADDVEKRFRKRLLWAFFTVYHHPSRDRKGTFSPQVTPNAP